MASEKCHYCGTKFLPDYSFCPHCGKSAILEESNTIDNKQDENLISKPSKSKSNHIKITLPSLQVVTVMMLLASLIMVASAIFQVKNNNYVRWKNHRDECIANQQELGSGTYSQRLSRDYDDIIADAEEKMKEYEGRAVILSFLSVISLSCGLFLFLKQKRQHSFPTLVAFCSNCGCKLQGTADFCHSCGCKIVGSKQKSTIHGFSKYVAFGLTAVALLIGLICYQTSMTKKDVFKRAFENAGGENFCGEWVTVFRDGSGLKIDTNPADIDNYYDGDALTAIKKINSALDLPATLIEKMTGTRALDGRQTATYGDITVSWTYHPDHGLEILYERK